MKDGIKPKNRVLRYLSLPDIPERLKNCGELINDLNKIYPEPKLCHVREKNNTIITMYAGKKLPIKEIKERWNTELLFKKRWPVVDRKFSNAPGVYKNLETEYPATARKQNRQFNHFGDMMSPRELARIQGLPDSFKLAFNESNPTYWINKGRVTVTKCPPLEIGQWFAKKLTKIYHGKRNS